jgi:hypothetical protein
MQSPLRILSALIAGALVPLGAHAHESFLLWHSHHFHLHDHAEHAGSHDDHHGHDHSEDHAHPDSKGSHKMEVEADEEPRWAIGTGVRYTRLSLEGERAHLWEAGLGISYQATSWLHLGAEAVYGWFDSREGRSGGWMVPHFYAEAHLPVAENWEVALGAEVGTPGGDEGLVGDHWELAPAITVRYDKGKWFAEAGASFVFILGGTDHDHGADHEEHGEAEAHNEEEHHEEAEEGHEHEAEEHGHETEQPAHSGGHAHAPGDYHEVVDPHGERELHYHAAFGVRLLDERLTLEGRFHGVHVTSGETEDRDYLRAGVRAAYVINETWSIRTEGSVPITDARRNQWQTSVSLQVSF